MKKILIIEDDSKISLALGIRLKSMGYEVCAASDAVTAMAQARKADPDVVLIDIGLPGGDGFMVADRLRTNISTSTTPFIFVTASKEEGLRERAYDLGASGFFEKPFDATLLADAIEQSLGA